MFHLNLPDYNFRLKFCDGKNYIFDTIRKKYVIATPEEWVRQRFIRFLCETLNYPESLIAIEKQIQFNGLKKRCDAVIYNKMHTPEIIVELKAPSVTINQMTFDQASVYNYKLKVNYLFISNGLTHYACKIDHENQKLLFLPAIPSFDSIHV